MRQHSPKIQEDVFQTLGSANFITRYQSHGAGGLTQLKTQLAKWKKILK